MRSKSDGAKVLYQVDDDSPGLPRTKAVKCQGWNANAPGMVDPG